MAKSKKTNPSPLSTNFLLKGVAAPGNIIKIYYDPEAANELLKVEMGKRIFDDSEGKYTASPRVCKRLKGTQTRVEY